jgi:nickel transport protein
MKRNQPAIKLTICPVALVCLVSLMFLWPSPALAHRVSIFAWVEGDTVHTQSKFFGGKKINHGRVSVYDASGTLLLEGETDENGEFSFKAPVRAAMKIIVSAGMGHQADWTIKKTDFDDGQTDASPGLEPLQPSLGSGTSPDRAGSPAAPQATRTLTSTEIEQIIEKALDKKLTPVIKMISELYEKSPSLSDILGGIGYIIGLVGLAAYINSRKKKDRNPE